MTITIKTPEIKDIQQRFVEFRYDLIKRIYLLEDTVFNSGSERLWKIYFRFTGRCGSRSSSHFPIKGNRHKWLWTTRRYRDKITYTCNICGYKLRTNAKFIKAYKNYSKVGRNADMDNLVRMEKTATNETEKNAVRKSMHQINHEDKRVRAMREDLIVATRANDHDKIKEIHEYVGTHKDYRNG